jgi:regulatory protein
MARGGALLPAFDRALDALARRSRSVKELERWLAQREYQREEIAGTIERLVVRGLLNDEEYARLFVRSRLLGRGQSRRRIQAELTRRGVSRDVADAALAEVMEDESVDERALVESAARKKMRSLEKLEPDVRRRRLLGFLARRGYDANMVRETVAKLSRE